MIRKLIAKLISHRESQFNNDRLGMDIRAKRFQEESAHESRLAKERQEQIMAGRDRKYVSERTIPSDEEILGPSDSAEKKEG